MPGDVEGPADGGGATGFLGRLVAAPVLEVVETGRRVIDTLARRVAEHRRINLERYKAQGDLRLRHEALQMRTALRREEMEARRKMLEALKQDEWRRLRFHHDKMLQLARQKWEAALNAEEHRRILDHYALRVLPSQILPVYDDLAARDAPLPLLVLLSPPALASDTLPDTPGLPPIEKRLTNRLRAFLDSYASDGMHPVRFLGGAWASKASYGEAAVHGLHLMLPSVPTLVLESEIEGGSLSFRAAYWGMGEEDFTYRSVLPDVDIHALLRQFARETAGAWREQRDPAISPLPAAAPAAEPGGADPQNQQALQRELEARELGVEAWEQSYVLDERHYRQLERFLTAWHCLVAAWVADSYHLFHGRRPPRLPSLLPALLPDLLDEQLVETVVTGYVHLYEELGRELEHWMPELLAELARSLGHLRSKRSALRLARRSTGAWLTLRGAVAADDDESLARLEQLADPHDEPYLAVLRDAYAAAERPELAQRIGSVLADWRERRQRGELPRDSGGDTVYGAFRPK